MTDLELREAVARGVMGLEVGVVKYDADADQDDDYVPYKNSATGQTLRGLMYHEGARVVGNALLKRYESDISAAFEVVEKMRENGYTIHLSNDGAPKPWECEIDDADYKNPKLQSAIGCADTAPRAICLAALQAVRAK
jgi:hypothetical protein